MPINFGIERFDPAIDETINTVYAALCEHSRTPLIENLLQLQRLLPSYYHSTPNPEKRAQEVYREFIQHLICYVCQTIKEREREPESLCLLLVALCPHLFHINDETAPGTCTAIVWSDPEGKYTVLNSAEKAGFNLLLPQLMLQANNALTRENAGEGNPLLRQFINMTELKRELLTTIDMKLTMLWGRNEQALKRDWNLLLDSNPNYRTIHPSRRRLSNQETVALNSTEIDDFSGWLEQLHRNITGLINNVRDPITHQTLLDKERMRSPTDTEDFICYLADEQAYFASTFHRLVQASQDRRYLTSPVTRKEIPSIADRSHSLPALLRVSRGILDIKGYVLLHNGITIKQASKLASQRHGHENPSVRPSVPRPQPNPPHPRPSTRTRERLPDNEPPRHRRDERPQTVHPQRGVALASGLSHHPFFPSEPSTPSGLLPPPYHVIYPGGPPSAPPMEAFSASAPPIDQQGDIQHSPDCAWANPAFSSK